jgi:hypothetical protein
LWLELRNKAFPGVSAEFRRLPKKRRNSGNCWDDSLTMTKSTAKPRSDYPDFGVRYETISRYFEPPLARSTFHNKVQAGTIIPMKGIRGFYLLNESLRRLGLREVRELPAQPDSRSLEDVVRLAFTLIDRELFPEPSWLLHVEAIDVKDADHAQKLADQYREKVASLDSVPLKLAYFQGVLDWVSMEKVEVR